MRPDIERLRALVGGQWAVSWQGYLLGWPLAVLFTFFAAPSLWVSETTLEGLIRGITAGTLAYLPVGLVLWLASITVLRGRRENPASITLVALVGAIGWTARSLTMIGYLQVTGLPSEASPAVRLATGAVQGALATTLAAWLLASTDRFHQRRSALLYELADEELASDQLADDIQQIRAEVLTTVRRTVETNVSRFDGRVDAEPPSARSVDALATAANRVSRELAHELISEATRSARLNPLVLIRSAVANHPFAYWGLLPSVALGLAGLSVYWPVAPAAIALATVTSFALLVSFLANAVTRRLPATRAMAVYLMAIACLLSTPIVMNAAMLELGLDPSRNNALGWSVAVNFGLLYPLIGIGAHIGRAREAVLTRLQQSISEAEVQQEALRREKSRLQHEFALSLHGGLQADLTASTIRAQHAIDDGDVAAAQVAIEQARLLMRRAVNLPQATTMDLPAMVNAAQGAWEGIVEITTGIRVQRAPGSQQVAMVREVLLEGIGNAVRHGGASSITVEIDDEAGNLRVTISDDGCGTEDPRAGLGSAMFDDLGRDWRLRPGDAGGAVLEVTLKASFAND